MARYELTFSADANTEICKIKKPRHTDEYRATAYIFGTGGNNFGSGTVKLQGSPDEGTTKLDLTDSAGSAYSATADDVINFSHGVGGTNSDNPVLYVDLSGSSSPSVKVVIFDNT